MTDLTQKVKYEVVVDLGQLTNLKKELDNAEEAAKKLGASLDKLAGANVKGLRQLGGTVQALGTRLGTFAKAVDPSSEAVTRLQAALGMIPPAATKAKTAIKETGDAIQKVGDTTVIAQQKTHDWRLSLLKYYGTFQVFSNAARQVWQGIQEGARQVDLDNTLTRQFSNFREELERAQRATGGTVGKGQLTKSFALMSSFGIPMDQFAENMELVQKMAIRTGQSADFLADSFARGISRLSPLILDNLGIQVSLADANREYAATTGKSVDSMSKQEQVGALLNQVLGKLRENTKGITLASDSAAAAVNRANAAWDDFWLGVKTLGGKALMDIDREFAGAATDALHFATVLDEHLGGGFDSLGTGIRVTSDQLSEFARHLADAGEDAADLLERWDELGGETGTSIFMKLLSGGVIGAAGNSPLVTTATELGDEILRVQGVMDTLRVTSGSVAEEMARAQEALEDMPDSMLQAAVPAVEYAHMLARAEEYAKQFISSSERALTVKEEEIIKEQILLKFKGEYDKHLAQALRTHKAIGGELGEILASEFRQGYILDDTNDALAKMLGKRRDNLKMSEDEAAYYEEIFSKQTREASHYEMLYALKNGITLAEQNLKKAEEQRAQKLREIEDIEKKYEEGRTKSLRTARVKAYEELSHLNAMRDAAQTMRKQEDAWLASFKGKSKDLVLAEITKLEALAAQLEVMEKQDVLLSGWWGKGPSLPGAAENYRALANKMRAEMEGRGRGPGSGPGAPKPEKPDQGWGWDYEAVFARQEAEAKALERFKEQAERLKEMRSELRRALVEDPSGRQAADALAEIRRMFGEMSEEHGAAWTTNMLTKMFGENGIREIFTASDAVDKLSDSFDRLINLSDGLRSVSEVMGEFRAGMSSIHGDLFGGEFISMIDDVGSAFDNLAEIQRKNAEATDKSHNAYNNVLGGIGAMRAFTQNLIKDRKDQAKVEALMQAAAAWAAWAIPDPVKAMGHTVAATMYAAVGFGAIKLPSGKAKSTTPRESRSAGGEAKRPDIHIHIAGNVVQTEAERGVMAQAAIQEARRRGML